MAKLVQIKAVVAYVGLLAVMMLQGCESQSESVDYPYLAGMKRYLTEVHQVHLDVLEDQTLFFLDINSCEPCVQENLQMLGEIEVTTLTVVLLGSDPQTETAYPLNKSLRVLRDETKAISRYRTGVGKPTVLRIKEGQLSYYRQYNSTESAHTAEYLRSLN